MLTIFLTLVHADVGLPSMLLLYLLVVVGVAAIGGFLPSLLTAVVAFLLANYFFTPPIHTFTIAEDDNLVSLIVFVVVGAVVGTLVSRASRRQAEAARARADAETLAQLGATLISEQDPLPGLMAGLRSAFGCISTAVLRMAGENWMVESSAGTPVPQRPEDADVSVPLDSHTVLVVSGIDQADLPLLGAFTGQLALVVERRRLRAEAAAAEGLAEANTLRTALLAAVSHDLRTPLASIKAAATSLLQDDVTWTAEAEHEFLETIDEETDRLNALVGNLLDMSRLHTGAVELVLPRGRLRRGRPRRSAQPRRDRGRRHRRRSARDAAPGQRGRRTARARGGKPRRQRGAREPGTGRRSGWSPDVCSTASSCASSTKARGSRPTNASACSSRSSGSATDRTGAA